MALLITLHLNTPCMRNHRAAAAELFGQLFPPGPLPLRTLRNSDFQVRPGCN